MSQKKQRLLAILSMVGSVALWTVVTDAWNYSALLSPEQLLSIYQFLYGCLSRLVWMLPAFLLIRRFDKDLFWNRKQLFSKPKTELVFLIFVALTTIYALASAAGRAPSRHITRERLLLLTLKFLFVAIGEEAVFRGWGYNLLRKVHSNTVSLIISAFLFAVLHWPAYFIRLLLYGQFSWSGIIAQSISALVCGLLFAVMLQRSGTLWNPIIAHFYYDWILEVLS